MARKNERVHVKEILEEFSELEKSSQNRKGKFKIEHPFEQAMKKILKANPGSKPAKAKKQRRHNT